MKTESNSGGDEITADNVDETHFSTHKTSEALSTSKCEICKTNSSKYRCPRCEKRTCSLECCKKHKLEFQCDGVKKSFDYIPLEKYKEGELFSDYRFLENINRTTQDGFRRIPAPYFVNYGMKQLQRAGQQRGTFIKFLCKDMTRRKQNTTYYDFKAKVIYWRIEYRFSNGIKLVDEKVHEDMLLKNAIQKHFRESSYQLSLKAYICRDIQQLGIFLRVERTPANSPLFYKLNVNQTIRQNMVSKELVEFPTLHIVLPKEISAFPVARPDQIPPIGAVGVYAKNWQQVVGNKRKYELISDVKGVEKPATEMEEEENDQENDDQGRVERELEEQQENGEQEQEDGESEDGLLEEILPPEYHEEMERMEKLLETKFGSDNETVKKK